MEKRDKIAEKRQNTKNKTIALDLWSGSAKNSANYIAPELTRLELEKSNANESNEPKSRSRNRSKSLSSLHRNIEKNNKNSDDLERTKHEDYTKDEALDSYVYNDFCQADDDSVGGGLNSSTDSIASAPGTILFSDIFPVGKNKKNQVLNGRAGTYQKFGALINRVENLNK